MDPNQTLADLRKLAQATLSNEHSSADAVELAERIQALDHWLSAGGFPPADWAHPRAWA